MYDFHIVNSIDGPRQVELEGIKNIKTYLSNEHLLYFNRLHENTYSFLIVYSDRQDTISVNKNVQHEFHLLQNAWKDYKREKNSSRRFITNDKKGTTFLIESVNKIEKLPSIFSYRIQIYFKNKEERILNYTKINDRDNDFEELSKYVPILETPALICKLKNKQNPEKGIRTTMIEKIKQQYNKHEDVLFPLFVVMALDFFFNDGRFQKKIMHMVEGILEKVTDKFTGPAGEKDGDK